MLVLDDKNETIQFCHGMAGTRAYHLVPAFADNAQESPTSRAGALLNWPLPLYRNKLGSRDLKCLSETSKARSSCE